ncbi:hypothetical protein [Engelhardtia mirabilis]|uniref:Uncharacterized protein n=1 Tax=Engelhardtia mirabilis TaxID=2528011 RepID=A0A518BP59_9BACT|nr:hypothetical protein Pla133_38640 [Planctomycetes bacterium Pla133]QDV03088.1 hypothetical protein Pla86_38630 [Planctomycetes bacterium Pla86]
MGTLRLATAAGLIAACLPTSWGGGDEDQRPLIGPVPALPAPLVAPEEPGEDLPPAEVETFGLWATGAGPTDRPLGVMRHVRLQRPSGTWQAEQELILFEPDMRVHQVERHGVSLCQLIYREIAHGAGRTVRARWPQPDARPPLGRAERLREWEPQVVQWAADERRVDDFPGARGWSGALSLIERQRWGLLGTGEVVRFEPLSGRPEPLHVTQVSPGGTLAGWRWYAWTGPEGEARGWMLYWKRELVSLAWQGGGFVARRIRPEVHAELQRDA